ncbi:mediator of RNA polymerase II transcription subunit 20 isoform X2 [Pogonomyrmex barbatus]|uniref:Mediator of RNA polymerase II transcription subunit 20 n=1 Tax=Pogonomyrmex barbatus TaxID=144034 RepID=A0A6I9WSY7_9HYME|nr:mediator of RNA polymerase II transcription subunit 20 isoform X2 [Pogonomyrmex barbatus]
MLQQYPMIENRTGPQTIEFLTKRVVALGAVQVGQFLVDCETYMSVPQLGVQRTVHVLHNSEQPASVFALLESGSKVVPLIADGLFDLLMLKMTNIYTSKKQTKIESKGPRFEIGDFCVKLGSVTMSQNFKGVLVEVSDTPYSSRKEKELPKSDVEESSVRSLFLRICDPRKFPTL